MEKELSKYIGQRIRYYRKELGLTQEELGKRIGASKSRISNYETGYRSPQQNDLFDLANALNITINELFPKTNSKSSIQDVYSQLSESNQSKVYNYADELLTLQSSTDNSSSVQEPQVIYIQSKLSAGTGIVDLDPTHTQETEYYGYVPRHDLAFVVSGDSMEPTFEDGEVVFVEKTTDIRNGQFIAVCINDEAYVKKAYLEEDRLRLVSLNQNYDDIIANENDDIRVVGKVIL